MVFILYMKINIKSMCNCVQTKELINLTYLQLDKFKIQKFLIQKKKKQRKIIMKTKYNKNKNKKNNKVLKIKNV